MFINQTLKSLIKSNMLHKYHPKKPYLTGIYVFMCHFGAFYKITKF